MRCTESMKLIFMNTNPQCYEKHGRFTITVTFIFSKYYKNKSKDLIYVGQLSEKIKRKNKLINCF